jgi:hypothetical protein
MEQVNCGVSSTLVGGVLVFSGCYNEIPWTGGLNNTHLFITFLEARNLKFKILSSFVSSEGFVFMCAHIVWEERKQFLSHKDTNLNMRTPLSWSHWNLFNSKGTISKYHHIVVRTSTYELKGTQLCP